MARSATSQSTGLPLLSTLYEPPPKHLISVLGTRQTAVGAAAPGVERRCGAWTSALGWARVGSPGVMSGAGLVNGRVGNAGWTALK